MKKFLEITDDRPARSGSNYNKIRRVALVDKFAATVKRPVLEKPPTGFIEGNLALIAECFFVKRG